MATPYIGEIRAVGFNYPPVDWLSCDGQSYPISQYSALYNLIGTIYGGDGVTTFKVPDLRGRVMPHAQSSPVLSSYTLGQTGGQETVTLNSNQLPAHGHGYAVGLATTTAGPLSDDPAGKRPGTTSANTYASAPQSGKNLAASAMTGTMTATGGGQAHSNVQPVLALNFIICAEGIYPPQQ